MWFKPEVWKEVMKRGEWDRKTLRHNISMKCTGKPRWRWKVLDHTSRDAAQWGEVRELRILCLWLRCAASMSCGVNGAASVPWAFQLQNSWVRLKTPAAIQHLCLGKKASKLQDSLHIFLLKLISLLWVVFFFFFKPSTESDKCKMYALLSKKKKV